MHWFDGHLDLACLAELGRDLTRDLATCGGPLLPAAVTFPSLAKGDVRTMLATIFTEADGSDAVSYPAADAQAAHAKGLAQLARYHHWHTHRQLHILPSPHLTTPPQNIPSCLRASAPSCLLLMECADPIRTPDELPFWVDRGVAAIGLAWARGSRYAAGNAEPGCHSAIGLTSDGAQLVRAMDRLGVVHDVSHLSDRAFDDLMSLTTGRVMASHSNSRALLARRDPTASIFGHRHLTDNQIRELDRRGGVIGLNLFSKFIRAGLESPTRPTIAEAIDHVEHICSVVGHRHAVALGSDLDGGLTADQLPQGINEPAHFTLLADELRHRNWSDADIAGFAEGNWMRFWALTS